MRFSGSAEMLSVAKVYQVLTTKYRIYSANGQKLNSSISWVWLSTNCQVLIARLSKIQAVILDVASWEAFAGSLSWQLVAGYQNLLTLP